MNRKRYFSAALLLFIIEFLIATVFRHTFLRPVFGDYLVVILLYCLLKSFTDRSVNAAALSVLATAYLIEFLQYIHILEVAGIQRSLPTDLILGSSFDWYDVLAYTFGFATILFVEHLINKINPGRQGTSRV